MDLHAGVFFTDATERGCYLADQGDRFLPGLSDRNRVIVALVLEPRTQYQFQAAIR
jgi:hypothetical protein